LPTDQQRKRDEKNQERRKETQTWMDWP
jgi:hypothetical protein